MEKYTVAIDRLEGVWKATVTRTGYGTVGAVYNTVMDDLFHAALALVMQAEGEYDQDRDPTRRESGEYDGSPRG